MAGGFTIFQSAISAIQANSQALSVTANNISNINTPGYSRQEIILQAKKAQFIGGQEFGLGVDVGSTRRIVDQFAELRLINSGMLNSQHESRAQNLKQVEATFNELNQDGLAKFINNFFSAFSEVASDPSSIPARSNLIGKARIMTDRFHSLAEDMKDARGLIDTQVESTIDQINTLTGQIAVLNSNIKDAGDGAMSMRDERTLKVQELGKLIDIAPIETSDGTYQVYTTSGLQLVNGVSTATLSTSLNVNNSNLFNINYAIGNGTAANITSRIQGGTLYGLITTRDTDIPLYQKRLQETAYEISNQVNRLHSAGYNLLGNTSVNFFDDLSSTAASSSLVTDLRNSTGTHFAVQSGNTITISGNLGGAFSTTMSVSATTTLSDVASALQTALRAAAGASGTETATVTGGGAIQVTSGVGAITGLTLSISGNSTFNTAMTFTTPITAGGGTGTSGALKVANSESPALISMTSTISATPDAIAASGTSAALPGGNTVALSIAALQNTNLTFSTGSTNIGTFYGNFLAKIGNDTQEAESTAAFSLDILTQAQIQREQISGVSLDEEQANLLRYQAAFQASTKLVSVANNILDLIVNMTSN